MPWDVGAAVAVRTLGNRKGTVIAADGNGRYRVRLDNVTMSCREEDLSSAGTAPTPRGRRKRQEPVVEQRAASTGSHTDRARTPPSVDLHGLAVDEALARVDEEINRALMAGSDRLEIIHGRGTGRIRDALHRHLASLPVVAAFRLDPANPGVTLVHF